MEVWSATYQKDVPVLKIVKIVKLIDVSVIVIPIGTRGFMCGTDPHDPDLKYIIWDNMYPDTYLRDDWFQVIEDFTNTCNVKLKSSSLNFCNCLLPDEKLSYAGIGPTAIPFYVCKTCKKEIEHI